MFSKVTILTEVHNLSFIIIHASFAFILAQIYEMKTFINQKYIVYCNSG